MASGCPNQCLCKRTRSTENICARPTPPNLTGRKAPKSWSTRSGGGGPQFRRPGRDCWTSSSSVVRRRSLQCGARPHRPSFAPALASPTAFASSKPPARASAGLSRSARALLTSLAQGRSSRPRPRPPRRSRARRQPTSPATSRAARARSARSPPAAADRRSAASGGYSSSLKEHLEALSVTISIGICGCRRDDEQPADPPAWRDFSDPSCRT